MSDVSPVPFGGVLFADPRPAWSNSLSPPGHQCLSAECCSRTRTDRDLSAYPMQSPVPFGGVLFADIGHEFGAVAALWASPVPFGGVLFADGISASTLALMRWRHQCLSAECCSRTSTAGCARKSRASASHQCLSAECCSRTSQFALAARIARSDVTSAFRRSAVRGHGASQLARSIVAGHQCLSAECCSRTRVDKQTRSENARSPVPFGGVLFADKPLAICFASRRKVTSAFRRSAVRGRRRAARGLRRTLRVTSAFRRSAVRGRLRGL